MRKLKKGLALILTLCVVLSTNIVNLFAAETVQVYFFGDGGQFKVTQEGVEHSTSESFYNAFEIGTTVKSAGYEITEPEYYISGRIFKGWMLCEFAGDDYVQVEGTSIMDTETALNYPIPEGYTELYFIAQWAGEVCAVDINGNAGMFSFVTGDYSDTIDSIISTSGISGLSVDSAYSNVTTPVYWDPSRDFLGWKVYTAELGTYDYIPLEGAELLTTEQMLEYIIPEANIMFEAQWDGEDSDYYSNVELNAYGGAFTESYYYFDEAGEKIYDGNWPKDLRILNGKEAVVTLQDLYEEICVEIIEEPTKETAEFEGWLEFSVSTTYDESANESKKYTLISEDIYTTEQIMTRAIAENDTAYVAKWSDMAVDEYFADIPTVSVQINGSEGTFTTTSGANTNLMTDMKVGYTVQQNVGSLSDAVYWDPAREFAGWKVSVLKEVQYEYGTNMEWVQIGTGLFSTDEVLDYVITDESTLIAAQWDGDHYDYYSNVRFDAYYGSFTYNEIQVNDGWPMKFEQMSGSYGCDLKENDETMKTQLSSSFEFVSDPERYDGSDAEFEGWIEFKKTEVQQGVNLSIKYEPVSEICYSTEEMMGLTVPSYDVVYVAKWSDMELDDYYPEYYDIVLHADGGMITLQIEQEDVVTVERESFQYGLMEGNNLGLDWNNNGTMLISVEKSCSELVGWEIYEDDYFEWISVPAGEEPADKDSGKIYILCSSYEVEGVPMDNYLVTDATKRDALLSTEELLELELHNCVYAKSIWQDAHIGNAPVIENVVAPTEGKAGSQDSVVYCKDCGKELSRTTVPIAALNPPLVHPETEQDMMVSVESSLAEVPESITEEYPTVEAVEEAMTKVAVEADASFAEDGTKVVVFEAKLLVEVEENVWVEATEDIFPEEGVWATIPYPEGIDPDEYDFILTHMIVVGERAGEIEVLNYERTDDGLKARFMSLSPVAIAYQEKSATEPTPEPTPEVTPTPEPTPGADATPEVTPTPEISPTPDVTPETTPVPDTTPEQTPSNDAVNTGDTSAVMPYVLICMIALTGVMVISRKRFVK